MYLPLKILNGVRKGGGVLFPIFFILYIDCQILDVILITTSLEHCVIPMIMFY